MVGFDGTPAAFQLAYREDTPAEDGAEDPPKRPAGRLGLPRRYFHHVFVKTFAILYYIIKHLPFLCRVCIVVAHRGRS